MLNTPMGLDLIHTQLLTRCTHTIDYYINITSYTMTSYRIMQYTIVANTTSPLPRF